jgi:hypothetical protein
MYHKDGRTYLCKDASFHNTLIDADEWELEPFTGDRKVIKKSKEEGLIDDYNTLVKKYNALLDSYQGLLDKTEKVEKADTVKKQYNLTKSNKK